MSNFNRSEQILRDIRKVDIKVDTLINKINFNISKTNQEIRQRKEQKVKKN